MLNFCHTYLYFKDLIRIYFCGIYVILFDNKKPNFYIPYRAGLAFCRSTWWSTAANRRAQACMPAWTAGLVDRAVDCPESSGLWKWPRSTGRELCLCIQPRSTGRSTGQRAVALSFHARLTGRSTGGTTVIKMTVGRSTGRANLPFTVANGQILFWVINTHFFGWFQ